MKSRIKSVFSTCAGEKRAALVAYITGCDPDAERSLAVASAVVDGGADVLEVGIPFSDPLADGEANQLAAERAIASGTNTLTVLDLIAKIRAKFADIPIVIFTYLNPTAFSSEFSFEQFCEKSVSSGADAVLCLDLTPEEDKNQKPSSYSKTLKKHGLGIVSLVAPTSPETRIPRLAKFADSFIYYVSREGVTGEAKTFSANFADRIRLIKRHSKLPVVVGFGISSAEHVRAAASTGVDGVVVGSAIVRRIEAYSKGQETLSGIQNFVSDLKKGARLG